MLNTADAEKRCQVALYSIPLSPPNTKLNNYCGWWSKQWHAQSTMTAVAYTCPRHKQYNQII